MRRIRFASNSKKLLIINYYALRQQKQNESQEKEKVDEKPLGKSRAQGEANTKSLARQTTMEKELSTFVIYRTHGNGELGRNEKRRNSRPKNSMHASLGVEPTRAGSFFHYLFSNCFRTAGAFSSIVKLLLSSFSTRFLLAHTSLGFGFLSISLHYFSAPSNI